MISTDQNFKNMVCDYPVQSVEAFAREEFVTLPPGAVFTPIRQEQLKERLGDSFQELDTPIEVSFVDTATESLIFIFENESTNRADFLHYLAIVTLQISRATKSRSVVPVAVLPFRKTPLNTELKIGGNTRNYLDFSCLSCVLGTMIALEHEHSTNIVERMCLPLMAHDPADRYLVITRAFEGLDELEQQYEKRLKYGEFVAHYSDLKVHEKPELFEKYISKSPRKEGIMSLYDILHKEGEAIGEARGALRSLRSIVLRQGTQRFGPADEATIAALNAIDSKARLEIMLDRILYVPSWSELLA